MNPEVDAYVARTEGWPEEITELRPILQGCGLIEHIKWHNPCYNHDRANLLILQEMKKFLAIMFFKGALLFSLIQSSDRVRPTLLICQCVSAPRSAALGKPREVLYVEV